MIEQVQSETLLVEQQQIVLWMIQASGEVALEASLRLVSKYSKEFQGTGLCCLVTGLGLLREGTHKQVERVLQVLQGILYTHTHTSVLDAVCRVVEMYVATGVQLTGWISDTLRDARPVVLAVMSQYIHINTQHLLPVIDAALERSNPDFELETCIYALAHGVMHGDSHSLVVDIAEAIVIGNFSLSLKLAVVALLADIYLLHNIHASLDLVDAVNLLFDSFTLCSIHVQKRVLAVLCSALKLALYHSVWARLVVHLVSYPHLLNHVLLLYLVSDLVFFDALKALITAGAVDLVVHALLTISDPSFFNAFKRFVGGLDQDVVAIVVSTGVAVFRDLGVHVDVADLIDKDLVGLVQVKSVSRRKRVKVDKKQDRKEDKENVRRRSARIKHVKALVESDSDDSHSKRPRDDSENDSPVKKKRVVL